MSRDEKKQDEMRNLLQSERLKFFPGDVREPSSLAAPMSGAHALRQTIEDGRQL